MSVPKSRYLLVTSAVAAILAMVILIPHVRTSCPYVPQNLDRDWRFVGVMDEMRVYDVNAPAGVVVPEILREFNSVYYYAYATNVEDLNLTLPDLPPSPDVVYMITVPTRCGAETFAVVSSTWSRIYVGLVPISDRALLMDTNTLYCDDFVKILGCAQSASEVKTVEANKIVHYCFVSTAKDLNYVRDRLEANGRFVGIIGHVHVFQMDDNTMVNVVPGEPLGIIAYREENA